MRFSSFSLNSKRIVFFTITHAGSRISNLSPISANKLQILSCKLLISGIFSLFFYSCASIPFHFQRERSLKIYSNWILKTKQEITDLNLIFESNERSTPLIIENNLLFGSSLGYIALFDKDKKKIIWKFKTIDTLNSEITLYKNKVGETHLFSADIDGNIYALKAKNGALLWQFKAENQTLSKIAVDNDIVYFQDSKDKLYAISAVDGKWLWHYKREFEKEQTMYGTSTPVIIDKVLYTGFSDGYFMALDSATGNIIWERELEGKKKLKDIDSTAIINQNVVYTVSTNGGLYSIDREKGIINWIFQEGSGGNGKLLFEENKIYFGSQNGTIYIVDALTGKKDWEIPSPKLEFRETGLPYSFIIRNGLLIIGYSESDLFFFDLEQHNLLAKFPVGSGILSGIVDDPARNLYFLSNRGNLYSIRYSY